jgi:Fic family protein
MNDLEISIPNPAWGSILTTVILGLEKLRTKKLYGQVPPHIFFQLKEIFHIMETLGSARIEGNNTTLTEYVEKIIEQNTENNERDKEISNIETAIRFIEENTDEETKFSRAYFSELHKMITKDLSAPPKGEGSKYPGEMRKCEVNITRSKHTPPTYVVVNDYFEEFIKFINEDYKEQYQLLSVAVAHHRFTYIHPFDNGNGRMVRLLNYALLIKLGFKVKNGRIINPSSVFYADREKYYQNLGLADSLKKNDTLKWAEYFLLGLKNELEKIDGLLDKDYMQKKILYPTIKFALDRGNINKLEYDILSYLIRKDDMLIKSAELSEFGINNSKKKSMIMAKLRSTKIIRSINAGGRIYTINFANSYLLRGIIKTLDNEGFVSEFLNKNR